MFYAAQLLARKGPLGLVWLAAHAYEQLKRSQVGPDGGHGSMRGEAHSQLKLFMAWLLHAGSLCSPSWHSGLPPAS